MHDALPMVPIAIAPQRDPAPKALAISLRDVMMLKLSSTQCLLKPSEYLPALGASAAFRCRVPVRTLYRSINLKKEEAADWHSSWATGPAAVPVWYWFVVADAYCKAAGLVCRDSAPRCRRSDLRSRRLARAALQYASATTSSSSSLFRASGSMPCWMMLVISA